MLHSLNNENVKQLKQFNQSLKSILNNDFSTNNYHQAFIDKLFQYFKSNNQNAIYIGIIGFHQLSKLYTLEVISEKAKQFNNVFDLFNDFFLTFLDNCIDYNNNFQNMLMYKITKIFLKTIRFYIPSSIQENIASYEHWQRSIERNITSIINENQYRNHIIFKMRKIAYEIILRLYEKTVNSFKDYSKNNSFTEYLSKNQLRHFFDLFKNSYEKSITIPFHIYDYCLSCIYKMFNQMLSKRKFDREIIELFTKPHCKEKLIKDCSISDSDIDYWYSLPKEYIINQSTISKYLQNKRYLASELFNELTAYKSVHESQSPSLFKEFIPYLIQVLQLNEVEKEKETQTIMKGNYSSEYDLVKKNKLSHHKIKEGILNIFEKLKMKIMKYAPEIIEELIKQYVLIEFESPIGFLRERACSFIKEYNQYQIKDNSLLILIIQKLCLLLEKDKELPVKTMSALTLPYLIKKGNVKSLFATNLKPMMMIYLELIEQIEHVELILSINTILKLLKNDIKEYILSLCEYFAQYFIKETKKEQKNDQESLQCSDTSFVVDNVLHLFLNIIKYFDLNDELFHKVVMIIITIVPYCFTNEGDEHIEEGLSIIICILEKKNTFVNELWSLYQPILYSVFDCNSYDYPCFEENITAACYFIAKDNNTFLNKTHNNYLQITLDFFEKANSSYGNNAVKLRYTYQLIHMILETSQGKVDDIFIKIVNYIIFKSKDAQKYHKNNLGELLSSCILYNTQYCLNAFEENENLINFYFDSFKEVSAKGETKRYLLALCSIAIIPRDQQKPFLLKHMGKIIQSIITFGIANLTRNSNDIDQDILDSDTDLSDEDNENIKECINNEKYNITNLANLANIDNITKSVNQFDQIFANKKDIDLFLEKEEEEEDEDDSFIYTELSCLFSLTNLGRENEGNIIQKTMSEMNALYPNDFESLIKMINKEQIDTLNRLLQNNNNSTDSNHK